MINGEMKKKGFSLVELLTVMAITGILLGISAPSLSNFTAAKQLTQGAEAVRQAIFEAKDDASAPPMANTIYGSGNLYTVTASKADGSNGYIKITSNVAATTKTINLPSGVVVKDFYYDGSTTAASDTSVKIQFPVGLSFSALVNNGTAINRCRIVLHSKRTGNEKFIDFYRLTGTMEVGDVVP